MPIMLLHSLTDFSLGAVDAVNRIRDRQLKVGSVNIVTEVFSPDGVHKIQHQTHKFNFLLTRLPDLFVKVVATVSKADPSP